MEPPPAAPTQSMPMVPFILLLVAAIIQSNERLLFVLHKIGNNNAQEWHLAWVAFMDSMVLYPSCTLDGWFLFEFTFAILLIGIITQSTNDTGSNSTTLTTLHLATHWATSI
jgi:hypothetical protein